ncbi:uncharacterized protein TRAVEDRAFT_31715 [Trametes versicolor FP-101664 SS1]|uniref:uncharacterized protein n=1 Tax=Trametes versicolor (strain FP-101664) TaxID=717944 RepID=UPI0004622147|nr:uncharacterized protein TRAVEDRAFT_31715 [Trametes versicolor FP-101664 SS1]EIW53723.1 hypothetical protein TRAVEDRAFT_31715 [Trametes versicolor FP-101664 SS1]
MTGLPHCTLEHRNISPSRTPAALSLLLPESSDEPRSPRGSLARSSACRRPR